MKMKILILLPFLIWFSLDSYAQILREKINSENLVICSHRGAMSPDIPENSLYSMQRSKTAGIDMHEIDLAESKDGVLYLLHDKTLDRTTESTGLLAEKNSEELDKVKLKGLEENLPRFEQVLGFAKENQIFLMLDVKDAPLKKVIALVEDFGMLDQVMVLTFSEERAEEALTMPQQFLISVLITKEEDLAFYLCKTDNPYHLIAYLNQGAPLALYKKTKEIGLPIVTDTMGELDKKALHSGGQDYIGFKKERNPNILVTDYPLKLRSAMEN